MRLLYVDANVRHTNPTANLLPLLFRECFSNIRFFGPGFVDDGEVERGVDVFVDRHGPFDVVILGPATPYLADRESAIEGAITFLGRYASHRLSKRILSGFFTNVQAAFGRLPITVRVVSALNFDYYATTQKQIDVLLNESIAVLGPNEQFVLRLDELPGFAMREKHYVRKSQRLSNAWRDFVCAHPDRVVTATHFVSPQEYSFEPISARPYEVSVPGVEYVLRREASKRIAASSYRQAPKTYFQLYRLGNRLRLPVFSNALLLEQYNWLFRRALANTRCVYTARGGFGIPIRKFFEIPAAGSLLICSPPNGYADLGFEPGRHYLPAEPEDVVEVLSSWLDNPESQDIARRGQDLVIDRHSLTARGQQIGRCLKAMIAGTFRGARWCSGEFVVDDGVAGTCVG